MCTPLLVHAVVLVYIYIWFDDGHANSNAAFDAAEVAVGVGLLAAAGVGGKLANPAVGGAADPASKPVGLII